MDCVTVGIHRQVENAGKDTLFARLHLFRYGPSRCPEGPRIRRSRGQDSYHGAANWAEDVVANENGTLIPRTDQL